jgi:hypothetical protein
MRLSWLSDRVGRSACVLVALLGSACGGGGGGSSEPDVGAEPGPDPDDVVAFIGFAYRSATLGTTTVPPIEDGSATPPTLGAPLDLTVVFRFDGVPSGPFDAGSLPVYTTFAEVTANANVPSSIQVIPAKGEYVLVVDPLAGLFEVEFRPFVPTAPLQISFAAPAEAVPGLLPASTYHAVVATALASKILNLQGPGGEELFGTTSNEAAYYPKGPGIGSPPVLVMSEPEDGSDEFQPATYGSTLVGLSLPTFPDGPDDILLTYDQPVMPTTANLLGTDLDGDGYDEPVFFLSTRATRVILAHQIDADALAGTIGTHPAFEALSGLDPTAPAAAAADGSDIFLHDGPDGLLASDGVDLPGVPVSLAAGLDPSLLFVLLDVTGADQQLTVLDHVLGDPSFALPAADALLGTPAALDTGHDQLLGLTSMLDGRLLAYDAADATLRELAPSVVRSRPGPGQGAPGAPTLLGLSVADGPGDLFHSAPLLPSGVAAVLEVRDLMAGPSGRLYALAVISPGALPSLIRLAPVDLDGDGQYAPEDGTFSGLAQDVIVMDLPGDYVDAVFTAPGRILALEATAGRIDLIDIALGVIIGTEPVDVAALGTARAISVGLMQLDVNVELTANGSAGAVVRLSPKGVLPIDADFSVMQRNTFSSLVGVSAFNDVLAVVIAPALGASELLQLKTSAPVDDPGPFIDDVFLEAFDNTNFEVPTPLSLSQPAVWAGTTEGGVKTGGLRASVGVDPTENLGDFLPQPISTFNTAFAYKRIQNKAYPETDYNISGSNYVLLFLDTDLQTFPLPNGTTPNATSSMTVTGGHFTFRDFIIPEGVHVVARGSRPLQITATGRVEIHGLLDVSGTNGLGDNTFDSGFLPVPGGPGGAGGGRGGDSHPTLFDPQGPGSIDQYVTPERGARGMGPVVLPSGALVHQAIGGWGGLCTLGYEPNSAGYPRVSNTTNNEHHRPPGGGGGSFYFRGQASHEGAGVYTVESSSSWFPFSNCPTNDKKHDALYGNDENIAAGQVPNKPLQCVYMIGTLAEHSAKQPGAPGGDLVFKDNVTSNDYIGPGGEVSVLIGGQGGGGGGSRIDSLRHSIWSTSATGAPLPFAPHYPALKLGIFLSATLFDAKGGGGGGGGGGLLIRCFGDILLGRTGRIKASGGHGGGGEVVENSSFAAGGGGGSGGAVILQAANSIVIEADASHLSAGYIDKDGDLGATIDVSGGFGRDARTAPGASGTLSAFTYDVTRSDGGQGGFGLIQLQQGGGNGVPDVAQGSFLYARQRAIAKLGKWTGDSPFLQAEHNEFTAPNNYPTELRYIDMLHYRSFDPELGQAGAAIKDRFYILNGSYPPMITSDGAASGPAPTNEFPAGSGQTWFDTTMLSSDHSQGVPVVMEPEPFKVMETYNGYNSSFFEQNNPSDDPDFPDTPGTTYKDQEIPFSIMVAEPDGTPFKIDVDGQQVFDPANLVDRLPVVPQDRVPPPFGSVSRGTSIWMDFNGVTVRPRLAGVTPPFFEPVHGTHNLAALGAVQPGQDAHVRVGGNVPGSTVPARYVLDAGFDEPGLGPGPDAPPFNDIKVDSPEDEMGLDNVVTDNAHVSLLFQGAYPIKAGSHVPDPATMTDWISDLTDLDGHPLVRFQVVFDLSAMPVSMPFGPDVARPQVDYVRLRARY